MLVLEGEDQLHIYWGTFMNINSLLSFKSKLMLFLVLDHYSNEAITSTAETFFILYLLVLLKVHTSIVKFRL